ncbi:MAG: T9SS type A sorting domain-containing protein [Ignavibacteriales bacterium]|nr:T9SS type A sorting domain-containing protein [Ignavibacteriales bacterium]
MKRHLLFLVAFVFFTMTFEELYAQWTIWDCSTLPEVTTMNGLPWTKSDKTAGLTDAATSVLWSVVDDANISGNKLIKINEFLGDRKESWINNWAAVADPTKGITTVFRVRASAEMIAQTKVAGTDYCFWYVSMRDGSYRMDLTLNYPDTLYAETNAKLKVSIPNPTAWHIYRFTLKGDQVNVYMDENATPVLTATAGTTTNNYIKVGDTSTGGLFGGLYDWLIWDLGGAYAPGQGTPIPVSLTGLTSVEDYSPELPSEFSLTQNYPNPFNPTTQISFSLLNSGFTTLTVYNAIGQTVAKLVNEELSSGSYKVNFNAVNLPSGVYFYQIQSGLFNQTKKMILLK